jgi:PKD repeat protein
MKSYILLLLLFFFSLQILVAQEKNEPCASEKAFQLAAAKDPVLLLKRQRAEAATARFIQSKKFARLAAEPLRIVPVVFHIIHEGGSENISKAQIEDQIRILNLDYRRRNADTSNTPPPFKPLGADCNIEFRLAQKDPNGKCTDGINRIFSHLTNNVPYGMDTVVKYLSVWDNSRYLNIWVVKNFIPISQTSYLLGYAQFPDGGPNALDGVMIKSDFIGSIGTALNNSSGGRVATHEIGHWLNLHHIWGDAVCGDDLVADTPPQTTNNLGCPAFPHVTCGGPQGDLFSNYMDYSNGKCQNIFTKGQKLRMDATFAGPRASIVSFENLIFTGTADTTHAVVCPPKVAFSSNTKTICAGQYVSFTDGSFTGTPTKLRWTFEGGTPATSSVTAPVVQYISPGSYKVKLYAENSGGKDSLTSDRIISVSPANSNYKQFLYESFEGPLFPPADWLLVNDDNSPTWTKTTDASYNGSASIKINNFTKNPPNEVVELVSPVLDLSSVSNPKVSFRIAYGQKAPKFQDALIAYYSIDCGQNWIPAYFKFGNDLAVSSGGLQYTYYVPKSKNEWRRDTFNLFISPLKRASVRVKFQFISGGGNNIYLDDISIGNLALGVQEVLEESFNFTADPNPGNEHTTVKFNCLETMPVDIKLYDALGRLVKTISNQNIPPGPHEFPIGQGDYHGFYFLKAKIGNSFFVKKMVLENE